MLFQHFQGMSETWSWTIIVYMIILRTSYVVSACVQQQQPSRVPHCIHSSYRFRHKTALIPHHNLRSWNKDLIQGALYFLQKALISPLASSCLFSFPPREENKTETAASKMSSIALTIIWSIRLSASGIMPQTNECLCWNEPPELRLVI